MTRPEDWLDVFLTFPAVRRDGTWVIVVDGREIAFPNDAYSDDEAAIDALWFISENVLGYYRIDGSKLFRGTVVLPE